MSFGLINWAIVIGCLLGTTILGHILSRRTRGLEDFFLGGRNLPWWAVSGSIMASQLSAVSIIAVPGAIFREGGNLLFLQGTLVGFVIAKVLMSWLFVKAYYEQKFYSPYDFIEHRLGSQSSTLARGLFFAGTILGHSVRLLSVALVLSVVVEIPVAQSILILALVAVGWTLMGGITTIIWTDIGLFALMVGGAIITLVAIMGALPFSLGEMVMQLDAAAKLRLLDVATDPSKTWTLWTGLICFSIFELAQNSVDQVITQRMMCCRNYREARKAVLGSLGIVLFILLLSAVGLGVWIYYQYHPLEGPAVAFLAEQPSRALPYFITHELPVGVSGLLIAGIFAAGISTLDSALAALSETTLNGVYRKWIRPEADDRQYLRVSRLLVVTWGATLSLLAYLAARLVQNESLLNLAYKVPVLTYGPMLMIAVCALTRRGSFASIRTGVAAAVLVALALLILKSYGMIGLDQFWIYPITCLVFMAVAGAAGSRRTLSHWS